MRRHARATAPLMLLGLAACAPDSTRHDSVTFSTTMQWDAALEALSTRAPEYVDDWEALRVAPPPRNSSDDVARELAQLVARARERSADVVEAIEEEADIRRAAFAGRPLEDFRSDDVPAR